jgi:chemotaxis protein CheD
MSALRKHSAAFCSISGSGTANLRYRDRHFQCDATKVLPGEYFATAGGGMIVTLLGSCVSACIRDSEAAVGGMNHFLLPHSNLHDSGAAARYGSYAMELLINEMLPMGARRHALVAKVFGGANVVRSMTRCTVGADNAAFVLDYLKREGIKVEAADLGGDRPRRIHYFPQTGQVLVHLLAAAAGAKIVQAEEVLEDKAAHTDGSVELFT